MNNGDETDVKMKHYYEDIIQKMNVLSKSQTAFLKGFVHKKIQNGVAIVEKFSGEKMKGELLCAVTE